MGIGINRLQSQLLSLEIARFDPAKLLSENLLTHWWFWGLICGYSIIVIYFSNRKSQIDLKKYLNSKILFFWSEVIKWLLLPALMFEGIGFFYPDKFFGQEIMGVGLSVGIVVFMVLVLGFPFSIFMLSLEELIKPKQKLGINNLAVRGIYTALIALLLFTFPVFGVINNVFCGMKNAGDVCVVTNIISTTGGWFYEKIFSITPGILLILCVLVAAVIIKLKVVSNNKL